MTPVRNCAAGGGGSSSSRRWRPHPLLLLGAWAALLIPVLLSFQQQVAVIPISLLASSNRGAVPDGRGAVPEAAAAAAAAAGNVGRGMPAGSMARPSQRSALEGSGLSQAARESVAGWHGRPSQAGGATAAAAGSSRLLSRLGLQLASSLTTGSSSDKPEIFLFIGILSGAGQEERRAAVREAWAQRAQQPGQVVARFVLSEFERSPQVDAEQERYCDLIFNPERTDYKTIGYKTYYILEHAVTHYSPTFVLKTDDDAFINVPAMLAALRALCQTPGCRGAERLYIGNEIRHGSIMLEEDHRWNNAVFANHTGLEKYPAYMGGGGYVLSADLAATLVTTHRQLTPLKHTHAEDVTLAMWLLPFDIRRVDHPGFRSGAGHCCVGEIERRRVIRFRGQPEEEEPPELLLEERLEITEEAASHLCGTQPWLVVHKLEASGQRMVGRYVAQCSGSSGTAAAAAGPASAQAGVRR